MQTFNEEVYLQKTFMVYIVYQHKDTIWSLFNYV